MLGISATQRTGLQDAQIIFQIEGVRAEKQTLQNGQFEGNEILWFDDRVQLKK